METLRCLAACDPHFRSQMSQCASCLADPMREQIEGYLLRNRSIDSVDRGAVLQYLALYCFSRSLESWGIHPTAVMGCNVGLLVAASLAGVITMTEGVELARGADCKPTRGERAAASPERFPRLLCAETG